MRQEGNDRDKGDLLERVRQRVILARDELDQLIEQVVQSTD